jgi:hypothetical protein
MKERFERYHPDMAALRGAVLGSSAGQRVMKLRETHRVKVTRNEVRVSPLWARPCRAYNVQIELDSRTKASLEKIQQSLRQAEPTLLVCPRETLHVSVAWLLAVHASYQVAKDSLWERHAEEWTTELRRIADQNTGFRIIYKHVVATDSAVIALAQPSEPVNRIREAIRERLRLPPRDPQRGGFGAYHPVSLSRCALRSGEAPSDARRHERRGRGRGR